MKYKFSSILPFLLFNDDVSSSKMFIIIIFFYYSDRSPRYFF
jgi:hypothetical protein